MDAKGQCCKAVWNGTGYHMHQCPRKGVLKHMGKLYCKQHHPPTAEKRSAKRAHDWSAKWERETRVANAQAHKAGMYDDLIALLREYIERFDGDDNDKTVKRWLDDQWIPAVRAALDGAKKGANR